MTLSEKKREITSEERAEIVRLYQCSYKIRAIAARVGRNRKTVRRILEEEHQIAASTPGEVVPSEKKAEASKLDGFREAIDERVQAGLTGARILREIRELGYRGGRTILLDYLRVARGPALRKRKAFRRFETKPGEEGQVDWSPERKEIGEQMVTVHTLSVVLCHSRKIHASFYSNERLPTLLEGLEQAFQAFQGVPQRLVFDNMATVVLGRIGREREPLWNPGFLEFARHYGFTPFACDVRDPNRKGKVERPFQYIEADFLRGRSFSSWDDLAQKGKCWLDTIANRRTHGTTKLVPDEVWEKTERSFLIRLPNFFFTRYPEEVRAVGPDCVISVLGTRFSVPSRFAQQEVRVRILSDRFEVLDRAGEVVASHPLSQEQHGKLVIDPKHYEEVRRDPERRRGPARLEESFLARFPAAAAFLDGLKARMRGLFPIHLRTLVRLADRFGDGPLASALKKAADLRNFNAEAVRRILEREFPLLAHETMAPPASGSTLALGAIEDVPAFGDYDHLDADTSARPTPSDPEKPASEEASDEA